MRPTSDDFERVVEALPGLLDRLITAQKMPRLEHIDIPRGPGVYLFSDGDPIYVGQTRNLRERLRGHTIRSSGHQTATFAFLLAVAETKGRIDLPKTRAARQAHPEFAAIYDAQKARVARMDVQFIEIKDPVERTIFEVYAAMKLGTYPRFNSFETH
jgi:excinuclease UvrABC nuclease subunit